MGIAAVQMQLNSTCNVFGGVGACQQLPSDSKFAATCQSHDLNVSILACTLLCLRKANLGTGPM